MTPSTKALQWRSSVSIYRTPIIAKQLGLALGVPFGILIVFLLVVSGGSREGWYALGMIAALLALTWLIVQLLYRGRYDAQFTLDDDGALAQLDPRAAKRSRAAGGLAVAAGAVAGQPTVAGAGMLAAGNQAQYLPWSDVRRVDEDAARHTIILHGPLTSHVALFCTAENYEAVSRYVADRTGNATSQGTPS